MGASLRHRKNSLNQHGSAAATLFTNEQSYIVNPFPSCNQPKRSYTMVRRTLCLCVVALTLLLPATSFASGHTIMQASVDSTGLPTIDPGYIYSQLFYMVTHYQHREAGYDNNLPVNVNGHDAFAAYWSQEIIKHLQAFGQQRRHYPFPLQGCGGSP